MRPSIPEYIYMYIYINICVCVIIYGLGGMALAPQLQRNIWLLLRTCSKTTVWEKKNMMDRMGYVKSKSNKHPPLIEVSIHIL